MENEPTLLDLSYFAQGTPCLSPARAAAMAEAAVVCLMYHGHRSGVQLSCEDPQVQLVWTAPDHRAVQSHDDLQEATEEGATAIAILWVRSRTGLQVVRRSRKGPGFDWYLGPETQGPPFANTHCLEVSGILDDNPMLRIRRLREKVAQVRHAGTGVTGYAVVIGFQTPAACIGDIP